MPDITLPDQTVKKFDEPVTGLDVARSIGAGLARAAVAVKINGVLDDLSTVLDNDAKLEIITRNDVEGLEVIRHSTAHLLAHAVKELFPGAQVTIGPVIENGFYYDFSYERPFTPEDLVEIENKMHDLAKRDLSIKKVLMSREKAIKFFNEKGEKYKAEIIESIPKGEDISLYSQDQFTDLCRGPHVLSTSNLKVFKLMKVAGAYWRGDSANEMLQRIYGTAWGTKEELKLYVQQIEEAEKRDHRRIGKQLDLFHMQDEAPGMVFWHPKGWVLWHEIETYMRRIYVENGYQEIRCPQILDINMWKKSGHWDNFRENMFLTSSENREYAVKPMNCPGHVQVFANGLKSYRELPIRYGEFGSCHRDEPSGALHGIMRLRAFTQDDGHIFCTESQIESEVVSFHRLAIKVYRHFGFSDISVNLALRPTKRLGSDKVWDDAEESLRGALTKCDVKWKELPGEGAFYGPKIEYHLKDSIGRSWQCGTVQVDFMMPGRLGAQYVSESNERMTPVMLHRAILGSMERFIGIVIENSAGALPLWLCPRQIVVVNISEKQAVFANTVVKDIKKHGYRAVADLRNEKISYKIREHSAQRVPFIVVVGEKEKAAGKMSVRARGEGDLGEMSMDEFLDLLEKHK